MARLAPLSSTNFLPNSVSMSKSPKTWLPLLIATMTAKSASLNSRELLPLDVPRSYPEPTVWASIRRSCINSPGWEHSQTCWERPLMRTSSLRTSEKSFSSTETTFSTVWTTSSRAISAWTPSADGLKPTVASRFKSVTWCWSRKSLTTTATSD